MQRFSLPGFALVLWLASFPVAAQAGVEFTVRSAQSGKWSDPATWTPKRVPGTGDLVQVRPGHRVVYDVASEQPIRMLHVTGTLTFSHDRSTRLDVGLIKVQPGEEATEDGFLCDHCPVDPKMPTPALEVGTVDRPIPLGVTATIRLVYFEGTDRESLPGILVCRGRWDSHGAPMSRTWVKLGATARVGDARLTLAEPVSGWNIGDRVIVTASNNHKKIHTFRGQTIRGTQGRLETEERRIIQIDSSTLVLDKPLAYEHQGAGEFRSEVANLSRNVVVESANQSGVRGHTMYHRNSAGGIGYAEFRHLGKENLLGKYPIHFHLVGNTMRGSGVVGASIWDSHNRWIALHGTDYVLVRDCVGYQSIGHGYFLEDATEQYNVLDRNLAVQAFAGQPLPKQTLAFDRNEGAGFWWANGRNTFIRNVACESERYGFLFEITTRDRTETTLPLMMPDGTLRKCDVRTIPFLRFEENEAHSTRLYGIKFGDPGQAIRGDRQRPFVVRNLKVWQTRYALRPNVDFFLLDGLRVNDNAYGIYGPSLDMQVFRNISLTNLSATIIGTRSPQYPTGVNPQPLATFENVTLENCRGHMAFSPSSYEGHFRNLVVKNCAREGVLSDSAKLEGKYPHRGTYYLHDYPLQGSVTKVVHQSVADRNAALVEQIVKSPNLRAATVKAVEFPTLLEPVDDLPPATMINSPAAEGRVRLKDGMLVIRGTTTDNGKTRRVLVNGVEAQSTNDNFRSWEIRLTGVKPGPLTITAEATDEAGNVEKLLHRLNVIVE